MMEEIRNKIKFWFSNVFETSESIIILKDKFKFYINLKTKQATLSYNNSIVTNIEFSTISLTGNMFTFDNTTTITL